jgi:uncharacterized protein
MGVPTPRERLGELFAKLDAFFATAKARHGAAITCHAGCDDCCRRRISVTSIEAAEIRDALAQLPADRRREVAERAARVEAACPALDRAGRCAVYEARPTICRTHGLPIRFTPERERRSLPVVDACPKNFSGEDLATIDTKSVLDQATLSTVLAALDAAFADAEGKPRGERIEMTSLCAGES